MKHPTQQMQHTEGVQGYFLADEIDNQWIEEDDDARDVLVRIDSRNS
jgi:hypothetical protein